MADHESSTVAGLVRGILNDVRDLIREEIALARAEIREEIGAVRTVAVAYGAAVGAAVLGVILLCIAIGNAIAYFLHWPEWTGYGIVGLVLLGIGYGLSVYGRGRMAEVRTLPKTTETVKENLEWMQNKSAGK